MSNDLDPTERFPPNDRTIPLRERLDRAWAPRWRRVALFVALFFAVGAVITSLALDLRAGGPSRDAQQTVPRLGGSADATPARTVEVKSGSTPPPFVENPTPSATATTAPPRTSSAATPPTTLQPTPLPTRTPPPTKTP